MAAVLHAVRRALLLLPLPAPDGRLAVRRLRPAARAYSSRIRIQILGFSLTARVLNTLLSGLQLDKIGHFRV